jgi:hypothetical protein
MTDQHPFSADAALPILDHGRYQAGLDWEFRAGRVRDLVKVQLITGLGGGGFGGGDLPPGRVLKVTWRGRHGPGLVTLAAEVEKSVEEAVVIFADGSEQEARIVRAPDLPFDFVFAIVHALSDPVKLSAKTLDGAMHIEEIEMPV